MNMIGHNHKRMQLIVSNLRAIPDRLQNQSSDLRLSQKHRPTAGIIQQSIHSNERLPGSETRSWKSPIPRKAVKQSERDKKRLSNHIEMRQSTFSNDHILQVPTASQNSPAERPTRPPQAKGLPHILLLALTAGLLSAASPRYPSPIELALSPDNTHLYVLCEGTDELTVLDPHTGQITSRIPVGRVPKGLSFNGRYAYVANSWSDTVSEIDTATLQVTRTLKTGFEPNAVFANATTLFTANRIGNDISVIDLSTGAETRRLAAGRGASYLTVSPDGQSLYCTHIYPNIGRHRAPPESEITIVDSAHQTVRERQPLHNVAGIFHVAFSADGRLGIACQLRPKNLIPLAHVEHGWVFGDSLTLFGADVGEPIQILIDELERYYTMPFGVAIAPDKSAAYISTTGANSVTVIDLKRLLRIRPRRFPRRAAASSPTISLPPPISSPPASLLAAPPKASSSRPMARYSTSPIDWTTPSLSSTLQPGKSPAPSTSAALPNSPRSAVASNSSSMPASPFTMDSVALTATSNLPSTVFSGISNPMGSARTSSIIACSKTSMVPSPSNGTAAIPTSKPSAARAPKNTSTVRKVTRPTQLADLVSLYQVHRRRAQTATACPMAN